jgi:hypothetical protein
MQDSDVLRGAVGQLEGVLGGKALAGIVFHLADVSGPVTKVMCHGCE